MRDSRIYLDSCFRRNDNWAPDKDIPGSSLRYEGQAG